MITNITTLPGFIVNTNLLPVDNDGAALAEGLTVEPFSKGEGDR